MAGTKHRSKRVLWISLGIFVALSGFCILAMLWNFTGLFGNDSIYKPLSDCPVPPPSAAADSHWSAVVPDATWKDMNVLNTLRVFDSIVIDSRDRIYVAGPFSNVGGIRAEGIARFDPNDLTWQDLKGGLLSASEELNIDRLEIDAQDRLFISGNFNLAGDQIANGIAMWDGQAWHALGSGVMNGRVNDFALVGDGKLFAAGTFSQIGGQKVNGIAFWDGQAWQDPDSMSQKLAALLGAAPEEVDTIAYDPVQKALYAGGAYNRDNSHSGFLAIWSVDSQAWKLLADAFYFSPPTRMKMTPWGALIAGGSDSFKVNAFGGLSYWGALGFPASSTGIATYGKGGWKGLRSGLTLMGGSKKYLADHGDSPVDPVNVNEMVFDRTGQLYIVGRFISVDDQCMYGIARWDGSVWWPLGSGLGLANFFGPGRDLAFDSQGNLYVVGNFQSAGGKSIRYLARWSP